jgi:hypothetical protein
MQKAGSSDGYQFYIHQIICFEGRWPTDMFNTANPSKLKHLCIQMKICGITELLRTRPYWLERHIFSVISASKEHRYRI